MRFTKLVLLNSARDTNSFRLLIRLRNIIFHVLKDICIPCGAMSRYINQYILAGPHDRLDHMIETLYRLLARVYNAFSIN